MAIKIDSKSFMKRMDDMSKCSKSVNAIIQKGILSIEADAKRGCPVDTGNLRASISSEMVDECIGEVGTNVEYASAVEYGTRKVSARPFLGTAFESNKREILEGLVKATLGGE